MHNLHAVCCKKFLTIVSKFLFNFSKAAICYQRAFNLDSTDLEVGMALSQVLKDLGKEVCLILFNCFIH